jgi:hypothetical protein
MKNDTHLRRATEIGASCRRPEGWAHWMNIVDDEALRLGRNSLVVYKFYIVAYYLTNDGDLFNLLPLLLTKIIGIEHDQSWPEASIGLRIG